jgi:hypothetical protein
MAGQSTVSNTFETLDFGDFTASFHANEKTGDHPHVLFQDSFVFTASGERTSIDTVFDNSFGAGPGLTFNSVDHDFLTKETSHFNNHVDTLLDAIQQPQADLANLQQAAADTVSTHDAGLQPDLHAANVQASAFHLV